MPFCHTPDSLSLGTDKVTGGCMSRGQSIAGRFAFLGLVLIVSACSQRSAPVDVSSDRPLQTTIIQIPPQPVAPQRPQRIVRTPAVQPAPARLPQTRPFPSIGGDLPPPDINPVVAEVGTPRPRAEQTRRPPLDGGPASGNRPSVGYEAPPPPPVGYTPPPATTSDDYATLLGGSQQAGADGDNPFLSGFARGQAAPAVIPGRENPALRSPGPVAPLAPGETALVALLVPESDQRNSVRVLADGLAKAASLAAADIGEARLELRKYDTGGDPRKAAEAAQNAIADGARLIIGPLFSGSAAAVRPVAQAANVNVIAFTTDGSVLGGGLYSIAFLPETDVDRIVSYAAQRGIRNLALAVPDTPFGGVIARAMNEAVARSGARLVKTQPFKEDFRTLDTAAQEFAAFYQASPDVNGIVLAASGRSLQGLASFLAFRDVLPSDVKYLGLGLWDDQETFREATLRGGWFPGVDPVLKNDFGFRYERAYGNAPPEVALLGYDAVSVAAGLIRNGGFSQQALLSPTGFTGTSGQFRFLPDGRNERALSVLSVGQGTFQVVDPAARTFGTEVSGLIGG